MSKIFPRATAVTGLTLVETMVSLLIFLAVLAGVVPVYISYRLQTLKNPVRTGAVAVSQQLLDELRRSPINTLPSSGVNDVTSPTGTALTNMNAFNKRYNARILFCESGKAAFCDPNSRYIRVQVFQVFDNGTASQTPAYEVSTVFTKFETN